MSPTEKDPARGLNAAVAAVLNGERTRAKMTFDALATTSGLSKRTVMRQLSTLERHIDVTDLAIYAAIFNMTPDEVVVEAQEWMRRQSRGNPVADRIRGHLPTPREVVDDSLNESVTGDTDDRHNTGGA
jgi:hypothetical protein